MKNNPTTEQTQKTTKTFMFGVFFGLRGRALKWFGLRLIVLILLNRDLIMFFRRFILTTRCLNFLHIHMMIGFILADSNVGFYLVFFVVY